MKNILLSLVVLFAFSTVSAFADSGHDHGNSEPTKPVSASEAAILAHDVVKNNVKKGKLAKSWVAVKPEKAEQKSFKKGPEWVVVFKNSKVEDSKKSTLYVFLSLSGRYLGANFSGN